MERLVWRGRTTDGLIGQFKSRKLQGRNAHSAAERPNRDGASDCERSSHRCSQIATSPVAPVVLAVSHMAREYMECDSEKVFWRNDCVLLIKEVERKKWPAGERQVSKPQMLWTKSIRWIFNTPPVVHNDTSVLEGRSLRIDAEILRQWWRRSFRSGRFHIIWNFWSRMFRLYWNRLSMKITAFLVDDTALPFAIQYFVDNTNALLEVLSRKEARNMKTGD